MKRNLLVATLIITLLILTGCNKDNKTTSYTKPYEQYFDTSIKIILYGDKALSATEWEEEFVPLEASIKRMQYIFSRTDRDSELYQLNQKAGIEPYQVKDDLLFDLIKTSLEYAKLTDGNFDPTVGVLVDAWGIGNEEYTVPSQSKIDELLTLVDYNLVEINEENQSVYLPKKGMILDLGAIAKGYAADYLANQVKEMGYEHALLNLGGNVITIGERFKSNDDGSLSWGIGLENPNYDFILNPDVSRQLGYVSVVDKTIVTSGTYQRYWYDYENNDKFYHHILDPKLGYPVGTKWDYPNNEDLEAVVIITDSSTLADALSTAVFTMGLEKGLQFIETLDHVEAMFIPYEGEYSYSSKFDEKYQFISLM
jgi:FAD:protein FMN transferase